MSPSSSSRLLPARPPHESQSSRVRKSSASLYVESGAEADAEMSDAPTRGRSPDKGKSVDRSSQNSFASSKTIISNEGAGTPKKRYKPPPTNRSSAAQGDMFFSPKRIAPMLDVIKAKSDSPKADKGKAREVEPPLVVTRPLSAPALPVPALVEDSSDSDVEIANQTESPPPVVAPLVVVPPEAILAEDVDMDMDSPRKADGLTVDGLDRDLDMQDYSANQISISAKSDVERPKKKRKIGMGLPPGRRATPDGGYEYEEPYEIGPPGKDATLRIQMCKHKHGPNLLTILTSDGDKESWPDCDEDDEPDKHNQVDYWRSVHHNSEDAKTWRRTVGMELADFWDLSQKKGEIHSAL